MKVSLLLSCFCAVLSSSRFIVVNSVANSAVNSVINSAASSAVPRVSLRALQESLQSHSLHLHRALHESHGILRIGVPSDASEGPHAAGGLAAIRHKALSHMCSCQAFAADDAFRAAMDAHPDDVRQILLPDGSLRRTLATATVGFDALDSRSNRDSSRDFDAPVMATASPLALPSWIADTCGQEAHDAMEHLRDQVADVVNIFVKVLDHEKRAANHDSNHDSNNGFDKSNVQHDKNSSYGKILSSANHLEHFHVYTKSTTISQASTQEEEEEKSGLTLDYHTDAGFFLSFVPAMNCHSQSIDSSLHIPSQTDALQFEQDEVIIMMGAGAQYWLNPSHDGHSLDKTQNYPFVAASHALRLSPNAHRSWYGKMHLLPPSLTTSTVSLANGHSPESSSVAFGDIFSSFQLKNYKAYTSPSPVDGCGTTALSDQIIPNHLLSSPSSSLSRPPPSQSSRRLRLDHVNSAADCNNQTNFFCWFQCLDIPNYEQTQQYLGDGYSLYCLDPSILAKTGGDVKAATDPCERGYIHNSDCTGSWFATSTDKSVPIYELPYNSGESGTIDFYDPLEDQFCYGGTSMYMDGFHWIGTTCIFYLFPQWRLSTPVKYGMACLGSILFGIVLEYVLWQRRSIYALKPGMRRLALSALVYGIQLTMGYFIMLVVMTYSGPLFVSVIVGMMSGHILFNAQDSVVNWWTEKKNNKKNKEDTCCNGNATVGMVKTNSKLADQTSTPDDSMSVHTSPVGNCCENGTQGDYCEDNCPNATSSNTASCDEDEMEAGIGSCCSVKQEKEVVVTPNKQESCCEQALATEKTRLKNIPEGATPCCQYTL